MNQHLTLLHGEASYSPEFQWEPVEVARILFILGVRTIMLELWKWLGCLGFFLCIANFTQRFLSVLLHTGGMQQINVWFTWKKIVGRIQWVQFKLLGENRDDPNGSTLAPELLYITKVLQRSQVSGLWHDAGGWQTSKKNVQKKSVNRVNEQEDGKWDSFIENDTKSTLSNSILTAGVGSVWATYNYLCVCILCSQVGTEL